MLTCLVGNIRESHHLSGAVAWGSGVLVTVAHRVGGENMLKTGASATACATEDQDSHVILRSMTRNLRPWLGFGSWWQGDVKVMVEEMVSSPQVR